MKRVVITGLGLVSPVGLTVEESWKNAVAGRSGIGRISGFDVGAYPVTVAGEVKNFDPLSAGVEGKEARRMSRFILLALGAAKEAILDSGIDCTKGSDRMGCSVGVGMGGIQSIDANSKALHSEGPRHITPFFVPYVITNMAAGMIANQFGLRGPNICTSTACTSGTHGIGEGLLYIRNDMADVMVCGGSEAALCMLTQAGFGNMKALSKRNDDPTKVSRPFEKNRDGFVIAEGAGIVVLEEFERAKARGAKIYAELIGYGMSGDAYHITTPAPEGEGAQRCMREALRSAKINPDQVDYINAHGTSTELNDVNESLAINRVFGDHASKIAVSSTKSVTGHCLGAAGGIEAVFLAKSLQTGILPPTINYDEPDPRCNLDYVPNMARQKAVRYGISNSFGFGGTNGCLVMGKV